ncbi:MAG: hypothetical protein IAE86_12420 [Burkholderiaceae bacterium]|nr:hypothetical protein [Burkholderiaceae bacterium]
MSYKSCFALALVALSAPAAAIAQDVWRTPDGKPAAESPSRKAVNDFGVSLLVTADDWQSKWNTPSSTVPMFNAAARVKTGGTLSILTFVANPKPAPSSNELKVVSHIRVLRPDGSSSVDAPNLPCLRGTLQGPATNTRLCEAVIAFRADPGDQRGTWKVEVTVTDVNRSIAVPVEATFSVEGD